MAYVSRRFFEDEISEVHRKLDRLIAIAEADNTVRTAGKASPQGQDNPNNPPKKGD